MEIIYDLIAIIDKAPKDRQNIVVIVFHCFSFTILLGACLKAVNVYYVINRIIFNRNDQTEKILINSECLLLVKFQGLI